MIDQIKQKATQYFEEIRAIRRHLHQFPELSFQEKETSKYIAKFLKQKNIPFKDNIVGTGILATIKGRPGKKNILLRADIDALPIDEKNEVPYRSQNKDVMHACGHDAHTASMLGTICILNDLKDEFEGTVHIIFQPGEEKLPGGASFVLEDENFKKIDAECIIGQHTYPDLPAGKVGFKKGLYMASSDEIYVTVNGKGGHAALSNEYNNPIIIASKLLAKLDSLFMGDENICPQDLPTILAFGDIHGKGATNVIPDIVNIQGTFRTFDEEWRKKAHQILLSEAEKLAKETHSTIDFEIRRGYPTLTNDEKITQNAQEAAVKFLGKENVAALDLRNTSEDFAWYAQQIPACFYRFGVAEKGKDEWPGLHSPHFDIDESALETAMGLMAFVAIQQL